MDKDIVLNFVINAMILQTLSKDPIARYNQINQIKRQKLNYMRRY
jgi:hypothetical protein